jgi:hypothetical protein
MRLLSLDQDDGLIAPDWLQSPAILYNVTFCFRSSKIGLTTPRIQNGSIAT